MRIQHISFGGTDQQIHRQLDNHSDLLLAERTRIFKYLFIFLNVGNFHQLKVFEQCAGMPRSQAIPEKHPEWWHLWK